MKDDMNKKLQNAFNKIETPNNLDSILSDCKKQKVFYVEENNKQTNVLFKRLAFALATILFVSTIGFNYFNSNAMVSTIAFDVNPSIELKLNNEEKIIKVTALNEDAKIILEDMDLKGVDLDVAVNALIGSMIKNGYLSDIANSILVSVNSKNQEIENKLQNKLREEISTFIRSNNLEGAVLTQRLDLNNQEIEELSNIYGITKPKAQLIKEILKLNDLHKFEDLVDLSIHELNLISDSIKDSMENVISTGQASEAKYIGKDNALNIALNHAKLSKDKINDLEIEIDYEMNTMVYEIEFEYNNKDYDYDINAVDGTILNIKKKENKQSSNENVQESNKDIISKGKAKEIALNYLNVKESQISKLWIELEKDDYQIIYEVSFNIENTEYEFEINAVSGKIIDFENDD